MKLTKSLCSAVLGCVFAISAWGQSTATLSGIVTDPSGAVVPNAKVTVHSLATGLDRIIETDGGVVDASLDTQLVCFDEAIREVLSEALAAGLKDPRIGFVTVTSVDTSPDLRQARVYVSVLGDARAREDTLDGLASAAGFLQRVVAGLYLL